MNAPLPAANFPDIVYPEDDGQPMSESTRQFRWIVTIKENLELLFQDRADVFVAGDLLWYPVQGEAEIRQAPDAMVVVGRHKGDRGSYQQWLEENIPPQVVFEVLSPGNRAGEMLRKREFYERYGVEEYYVYDPHRLTLEGWRRVGTELHEIEVMNGWESPRLGIRFVLEEGPMRIYRPDGRLFLTVVEIDHKRQEAERREAEAVRVAEQSRQREAEAVRVAEQERQAAAEANRNAEQDRRATAEAKQMAEQDRQAAAEAKQAEEQSRQREAEAVRVAEQERQAAAEAKQAEERARQREAEAVRVAEQDRQAAAEANRNAEQDRQAAEEYRQRILRLEERLRAAGLHPEQ